MFLSNTEELRTWTEDEIDLLKLASPQISIGIRLFNLNDNLNKTLASEQIARKIIIETKQMEDHDQIFDYLLSQLADIYDTDRVLHLHYNTNNNLFVSNEFNRSIEIKSLKGEVVLCAEYINILFYSTNNQTFCTCISDVNEDIQDVHLKDYFRDMGIQAFLVYPVFKGLPEKREEIVGMTMVCSSVPKKWLSSDINKLKLIVDTTSIVYFELERRKDIDQLRQDFIAALTHDLRSPIIAEQKALEMMLAKPETKIKDFCEYLEEFYETNKSLLLIINNLLTVYHYESGKLELNLEYANIKDIIKGVINSLSHLAKDKNAEITSNIEENLPLIKIDSTQINRVLLNLISNAIQHNPAGIKINVFAKKIDNEIEISVSDNGQGISEPENIFQRYPTGKRKIGTGLGLYITKQIVELHQGEIWFETKTGKGTTFFFTLPVS
jgi:two-component sensor histidine kinase/GAF domain-containing protein